jgi:hypothetical protein
VPTRRQRAPPAGFDAHKKDEINFRYIGVTERDYEWLTEQLVAVANRCAAGGRRGRACGVFLPLKVVARPRRGGSGSTLCGGGSTLCGGMAACTPPCWRRLSRCAQVLRRPHRVGVGGGLPHTGVCGLCVCVFFFAGGGGGRRGGGGDSSL